MKTMNVNPRGLALFAILFVFLCIFVTILFDGHIEVIPRKATSYQTKFSSSDQTNFFLQERTEEESQKIGQELVDTFNKKSWHYKRSLKNAQSVNTSGLFNYTDTGTSIAITACSIDAAGALEIPATINNKPVTSIDAYAFALCHSLTSVTFPGSVSSIGDHAFAFCTSLASVHFTGNAPTMGMRVFYASAKDFTVYYLEGKTGFTSPEWKGYKAEVERDPQKVK